MTGWANKKPAAAMMQGAGDKPNRQSLTVLLRYTRTRLTVASPPLRGRRGKRKRTSVAVNMINVK
jgi:hypothetical protein